MIAYFVNLYVPAADRENATKTLAALVESVRATAKLDGATEMADVFRDTARPRKLSDLEPGDIL